MSNYTYGLYLIDISRLSSLSMLSLERHRKGSVFSRVYCSTYEMNGCILYARHTSLEWLR